MNSKDRIKCVISMCPNHKDAGTFVGDFCLPCHQAITGKFTGPGYNPPNRMIRIMLNRITGKSDFEIMEWLMKTWGVAIESMEIGDSYADHFPDCKTPLSMIKFKPVKMRGEPGAKWHNDDSRKIFGYSESVAEFVFDQKGVFLGVGVWEE